MGRKLAILWHASFSIGAGVLYFLFVLPRWCELMGDTTHALGNALRIVTGALVALAALPVVFTLLRTRKPELGTPQLALSIRVWSIVAHVLAGVLIIGTAISEYWLTLDAAGQYLFAIYGAAAAIGCSVSSPFTCRSSPSCRRHRRNRSRRRSRSSPRSAVFAARRATRPRNPRPKTPKTPPTTEAAEDAEAKTEAAETEEAEAPEPEEASEEDQITAETDEPQADAEAPTEAAPATTGDTEEPEEPGGGLRNRRPTGKGSHRIRRRRTRSGVALDE